MVLLRLTELYMRLSVGQDTAVGGSGYEKPQSGAKKEKLFMKNKIISLVLVTALLLIFGCSKKASSSQYDAYYADATAAYSASTSSTSWAGTGFNPEGPLAFRDMSNLYGEMTQSSNTNNEILFAPENPASSDLTNSSNVERKLVKRANIRIRVENLETADASVSDLIRKYGAYTAFSEIEENYYHYSIRVPSHRYDVFLDEMNGMGKVLRRSENTEDVTLTFYDLEGRLETKKGLLVTYQSYLGKAVNIQEILSVESKIADLQYDIDRTGTQLKNLANLVDYATIDLSFLGPEASLIYEKTTLGGKIKNLFNDFGEFLSTLAVVITGIIIYGIPILLLLVLFYLVLFGRIGLLKKLWRIAGKK